MSSEDVPLYLRENTYLLDPNDHVEMARQIVQDYFVTPRTDGLSLTLPDGSPTREIHDVLDIASGSGGWVLQMARHYPDLYFMGVDLSIKILLYARAQAMIEEWRSGQDNAKFKLMDVRQPFDFPDNSFDFVHARFLVAVLQPDDWLAFLQECLRVTRPGGVIRLTETEAGISNSLAYEQITRLAAQALKGAGRSFSPDGQHFGLLPLCGRFLREAGYQRIQQRAYAIDFSADTEEHHTLCNDFKVTFDRILPFLVKSGLMTHEEVKGLYDQALKEIYGDDFRAIEFYLSTWGVKPE